MNPVWIKALILVCVFGAVMLVAELFVRELVSRRNEHNVLGQRLRQIGKDGPPEDRLSVLRRTGTTVPTGLPDLVEKFAIRLERMLIQARLRMATGRLMIILLVAPLAIFFLLLLLMSLWWGLGVSGGRILICSVFALLLGAILPIMFLNFRADRARKRMQEQFPVALDVFVRGLRAGHPIAAALDLLTVEMPEPIGPEFSLAVDEITYGADLRDALENMAERWDLDDIRMFVVSLSVQSETGGNLAEILENLSQVIRERATLLMKVRSLSSEGRMTAVMLTVLPIMTFVLLFVLNPRFFLDVANDPYFIPGFVALGFLYLTGFVSIRRMVDLKV